MYLSYLKERPSQFAHSLFATMLWLGADETIEAFKEVVSQVPMRLLFTLNMYADLYFTKLGKRSVKIITGDYVEVDKNQWVNFGYNDEQLAEMKTKVETLLNKLQSKTTIGNLLTIKAETQALETVTDKALAEEVYDLNWVAQGKVNDLFL